MKLIYLIRILQKLEINKNDCFEQLVTQHDFGNETLIIIPTINENGDGYVILNSHLVLVDNQSKEIISKFQKNKDWYIDAVRLNKIEIDPIQLNTGNLKNVYKIKLYYSGSSRPDPYHSTNISWFKKDKDSLIRILKEYSINTFNGKTDTTCKGEFEEHSKTFEILDIYNGTYPKIKVIDSIKNFTNNSECEEEITRSIIEIDTLRFQSGEYKNAM